MQSNLQKTDHMRPSGLSSISSPTRMPSASFAVVNGGRWMTEEEKQQSRVTDPASRFISCLAPHLATGSLIDFTASFWGNCVLARFVAIKHSNETRFVEVFYVADDPSRRQRIQELERQLDDPKRLLLMRESRVLYVHLPGPIPSPHHPNDIPLGVRHVLQRLRSRPAPPTPQTVEKTVKPRAKGPMEIIEIDSDESEDDPKTETFSFAVIMAAETLDRDQAANHRSGDASTQRFWTYIQKFVAATDQKRSATTIISKLVKVSSKSYREVFCIKPSSPIGEAQAAVYSLKNRLREASNELSAMGMIFVELPTGRTSQGKLYHASEVDLESILRKWSLPTPTVKKPAPSPRSLSTPSQTLNSTNAARADTLVLKHDFNALRTSKTPIVSSKPSGSSTGLNTAQAIHPDITKRGPSYSAHYNEVEFIDISDDDDDHDHEAPVRGSKNAPIDLESSEEETFTIPRSKPTTHPLEKSIVSPMKSTRTTSSPSSSSSYLPTAFKSTADVDPVSSVDSPVIPVVTPETETILDPKLHMEELSAVDAAVRGRTPPMVTQSPLAAHDEDVDMPDAILSSPSYSQRASSETPPRSVISEENEAMEHEAPRQMSPLHTDHDIGASSDDELLLKSTSHLLASEHSSDAEDGLNEDTALCSEWAGRMAASMRPEVAKRYLAKARKYHRDPLDSSFSDMMRNFPTGYQRASFNRVVFESWILQSTSDESEAPAITVKNNVDDEPCPAWDFTYTNKLIRGDGVRKPLPPEEQTGCQCVGGCRSDSTLCACAKRQEHYALEYGNVGFLYDSEGRLVRPELPVFECNDACTCAVYCRNRVVQRGRKHALEIRKTKNRGWGIFAKEPIPAGGFIGLYSGELLLDAEAEVRGKELYNLYNRNYLFDLDSWVIKKSMNDRGKRFCVQYAIDAMHAGSFTRYLNHSCDPNSVIVPCIFGGADAELPYLCFFTRRSVEVDEEITFSYKGEPDDEDEMEAAAAARRRAESKKAKKGKKKVAPTEGAQLRINVECKCGSANCNGSIWNWGSSPSDDDE